MKNKILIVSIVVFLCSCSSAPIETSSPDTAIGQMTETPLLPSIESTMQPITSTPVPVPTNTPVPIATADNSGFPPLSNKKASPGQRLGIMSAANASFLYYFEEKHRIVDDYVFSYDVIYKQSRKTNIGTIIRKTEEGTKIDQIFLDPNGGFYYLCNENLYKYGADTDKLIAEDVFSIMRVDASAIYYGDSSSGNIEKYNLKDGTISVVAPMHDDILLQVRPICFFSENDSTDENSGLELYSLDLTEGSICDLLHTNGNYAVSDDGDCLVVYEETSTGMKFYIFNYRTLKKNVCTLNVKIKNMNALLVKNGKLFVVDDNASEESENISKSNIYVINLQTGKLVSKKSTDFVFETTLYQDKWYLYTCIQKETETNPDLHNQKIRAFDPETYTISTIASLEDKGFDDDQDYTFEVSGGYAWMIDYYCTESSYNCWARIDLAAAQSTASPTPELTPSQEQTPDPTIELTSSS